ncbi:NAD(P)/FAD-dependent oxidoreductase [Zarconia navalis]|uniref:NAD(P)/FAD-dependent oxidoreductase n=1 Tax=Zarconia navalis TaxID=2992134 RepID=UPI0021F8E8AE|nr:NAD(P)/FAD-dependent oxidoreductase [Zarconia navalis]
MKSRKPRVVVVGAGFAGLRAVRQLARIPVEILLIDRSNYHTFIPLLYQVATGFIAPEQIAYPLRRVLRRIPNACFLMTEANRVDFDRRVVETDVANVEYDYLIMATGARTRFLGVEGAARYSFGLNTLEDAVRLREQILGCFEEAEHQSDIDIASQLLTFTIVGGGPTGVELAGAVVDWVEGTLCRNYSISAPVRVILLQSGDRVLADFPESLSRYSNRQLRRRGVRVHFQTRVRAVAPTGVTLEDGTTIETATVIWTAGVEAHRPNTTAEVPTATQKKVVVRSTL